MVHPPHESQTDSHRLVTKLALMGCRPLLCSTSDVGGVFRSKPYPRRGSVSSTPSWQARRRFLKHLDQLRIAKQRRPPTAVGPGRKVEGRPDALDHPAAFGLVDQRVCGAITRDNILHLHPHQRPAFAAPRADQCLHPQQVAGFLHPARPQDDDIISGFRGDRIMPRGGSSSGLDVARPLPHRHSLGFSSSYVLAEALPRASPALRASPLRFDPAGAQARYASTALSPVEARSGIRKKWFSINRLRVHRGHRPKMTISGGRFQDGKGWPACASSVPKWNCDPLPFCFSAAEKLRLRWIADPMATDAHVTTELSVCHLRALTIYTKSCGA